MTKFQTKKVRRVKVIVDLKERNASLLRQQLLGFIENQV